MEDTILEQELVTNQRFAYHDAFGGVIISRPTPAIERKIAEERRKVYHKDLKDNSVLTSDEVSELLKQRGVWDEEQSERMQDLTTTSADLMARLTALGYESPSKLYLAFVKAKTTLASMFGEDAEPEISEALERVFDLEAPLNDKDMLELGLASHNSDMHDQLGEVQGYRIQFDLLTEFSTVKIELGKLIETHTKFFGDTIEARAAQTERMARVFYCIQKADGKPLWESFEDMWDAEPDVVAWASAELYYFEYGITDEYAQALQTHGFMARVTGTDDSSENSQGHPESNLDGESPESELESSSESDTPTS